MSAAFADVLLEIANGCGAIMPRHCYGEVTATVEQYDQLLRRIADLEAALREIIAHCETHSDGSWVEDEPRVIAKRALGEPTKARGAQT